MICEKLVSELLMRFKPEEFHFDALSRALSYIAPAFPALKIVLSNKQQTFVPSFQNRKICGIIYKIHF